ncbi:creatininase family protein [Acidianus sulfidivorans JP7]|uniref:Creatininase n=1 Tax=Acidianus sulfidivorans JP7 TaxID=619593 RepID=A0A2U9ILS3_9CREN|nr:creatininase family protein [Acidianus sulfidivorans]AWR96967.1 creatininase family protein [Acidianus sulfidivorans JP7]
MYLLYSTRDEIKGKIGLLPVGSVEQHGPHLPMGTDIIIAEDIAKSVEKEFPDYVVLFPSIYYGCSLEHNGFPYLGVGYISFYNYILDIIQKSKEIFKSIIIVNGHGGNESILDVIRRQVNFSSNDKFRLYIFSMVGRDKDLLDSIDMHAGSIETSRMKYLHPELVREEKIKEIKDFSVKEGVFKTITTKEANPYGVINIGEFKIDPEKGKESIQRAIEDLKKLVMDIIKSS